MIQITAIPAFDDNYIWCLSNQQSGQAVVVDPGDDKVVKEYLQANKLELTAILVTHHHFDHTGGIEALTSLTTIPVYGPKNDAIPSITQPVNDGDKVSILGVDLKVMAIPGHTLDHIAYFNDSTLPDPVLFCGDTLFAGGCGRIFEGTAEMMYQSLSKLAQLPDATRVYCAHEYTLANLAFAKAVEPNNPQLLQRIQTDQLSRNNNQPTVPSTLSLEKSTNPFLRSDQKTVISAAKTHNPSTGVGDQATFAAIRAWKDQF